MSEHTPGPWHVVHDGDRRFFFVDSQTEGSVCKIAVNLHSEANARLIAAAPDLADLVMSTWQTVSHGGPTRADAEAVLKKAGLL